MFRSFVIPGHTYSILIQGIRSMQITKVIHSMLYDRASCYIALFCDINHVRRHRDT
jgi:hypothetical protein